MENQSTYRIRTELGDEKPINIPINLTQEFNSFEILSLKVNTNDTYRSYTSTEGIVIGRVSTANNGLGIPNVRVSIFVPKGSYEQSDEEAVMYPFSSPTDLNGDRVRYNLLPSESDVSCYQVIGTMPTKLNILDNETVCEVFEKFYKYTTVTNEAGDFMLSNIPVGKQRIHIDADLSDIGPFLSQKPYDMIDNLGIEKNRFESTRQFKKSSDLDSLAQVISQNKSVYVYPYWGDATENGAEMKITRTDLSLNYEFKMGAIFIGSVITDKQSNSLRENCTPSDRLGKMSDMVTGPGRIEMIRKTVDNKIEQHRVKGDMLINDNGVWCYQVPMNLDYVRTDEYGNIIPTDDPNKGVPTRARVRFRITLNEMESDNDAHKRCSYLVPNNPKNTDEKFLIEDNADYSFGSDTWDESFVDLFWNKVYTVKNYIPQIQKDPSPTNRKHTGIKMVNHFGDNNPFPYNNLSIRLSFLYRLVCVISKIFIGVVTILNGIISAIGGILCEISQAFHNSFWPVKYLLRPLAKMIDTILDKVGCIPLEAFCDDGINKNVYYPGCGSTLTCMWDRIVKPKCAREQKRLSDRGETPSECTNDGKQLSNCIENDLAQTNDITSFNFVNDWINGCLYMPLWYRKIRPKKSFFFGLFKRRAKDQWCAGERGKGAHEAKIISFCAVRYGEVKDGKNYKDEDVSYHIMGDDPMCGNKCHKHKDYRYLNDGVIMNVENMYGQKVWYYKSVETDSIKSGLFADEYVNDKGVPMVSKTLFATDIVLLGSMNDCDMNGVPKFFNYLSGTTYNMPSDILFTDTELTFKLDEKGEPIDQSSRKISVSSGADWGNVNEYGEKDGGLFYSIGCSDAGTEVIPSSCINLKRICEIGVGLDEMQYVDNIDVSITSSTDVLDYNNDYYLRPDGFISYDDIIDFDYRSMFATMNSNRLKTKINVETGVREYDFRHLYIDNFDGSLRKMMEYNQRGKRDVVNYKYNYRLEETNLDYLTFRMGDNPYFYDGKSIIKVKNLDGETNNGPNTYNHPKYENSFYFYFGLKEGKTAIDLFNQQYNGPCSTKIVQEETIPYEKKANSWCCLDSDGNGTYDHSTFDGYLKINFEDLPLPCRAVLNSKDNSSVTYTILGEANPDGKTDINDARIAFFGKSEKNQLNGYARYYLLYENMSVGGDDGLTHGNKKPGVLCYVPANGEYVMNVIDGEGNQHSFNININAGYLTFDNVEEKFAQPNNLLLSYYKQADPTKEPFSRGARIEKYNKIALSPINDSIGMSNVNDGTSIPNIKRVSLGLPEGKDDERLKINPNEEVKLNGTICLYNLYYDDKKLDNFIIEVEADKEDEELKWYNKNKIRTFFNHSTDIKENIENREFVINGDEIVVSDKKSPYISYNDNLNMKTGSDDKNKGLTVRCYVIKCPKGGVNYTVTVTQVCKDADGKFKKTQNVVERKIMVSEPTPYKFFINGADYDIFKNFKTGWELSSEIGLQENGDLNFNAKKPFLPFNGVGNISNVKGWLNISDVNNRFYDWNEDLEKYVDPDKGDKRYEKLKKGDILTYEKYTYENEEFKNKEDSITISQNDSYFGRYVEDVQLELAKLNEPIEPKRYDFNNEEKYTLIHSKWNIIHQEWEKKYKNLLKKAQPLFNRLEFIEKMKKAFWLQNENEESNITFTVQTDDNPYDVWALYNDEIVSEKNVKYHETKSRPNGGRTGWIYTSKPTVVINGVKVPNITSYDSKDYGISEDSERQKKDFKTTYEKVNTDDNSIKDGEKGYIAFAQDNIAEKNPNGGSISIKPPYIVACVNNEGKTKPANINGDNFYSHEKNKYGLTSYRFGGSNKRISDDNGHEFFQFYMIDKIFSADIVCWSYMNNIPYFIPWMPYDSKGNDGDATKLGQVIKTEGIVSGIINNGITNKTDYIDDTGDFHERLIFDKDTVLKTYQKDTEDSIPTRRAILYEKLKTDDNDKIYLNYRHAVDSDVSDTNQYKLVPNVEGELTFSDKDSHVKTSRTLYGSMNIRVKDNSINVTNFINRFFKRTFESNTLNVNAVNGDTDNPITYYIFRVRMEHDDDPKNPKLLWYPLNSFDIKKTDDKIKYQLDCKDEVGKWDGKIANGYQFFSKNTDNIVFKDKNIKNVNVGLVSSVAESKVKREDANGDTVYDDTTGYGNTGIFTNLDFKPYFVVAVTENGCRAVSPVYDFNKVYYIIGLVNINGKHILRIGLVYVLRDAKYNDASQMDDNDGYKASSIREINYCKLPRNYYLTQFNFTMDYSISMGNLSIKNTDINFEKNTYNFVNKSEFDKSKIGSSYIEENIDVSGTVTSWVVHTKTSADVKVNEEAKELSGGQEAGIPIAPLTYYYETEKNEDGKMQYMIITIDENGWIKKDLSTTIPANSENVENKNIPFQYKIDEEIYDDDGNMTQVTKWYKNTLSYSKEERETFDYDPRVPHFMKCVDKVLSDTEYKFLKQLFSRMPNKVKELVNITVTDVVGIKHKCRLHTIVGESDGKNWKNFMRVPK